MVEVAVYPDPIFAVDKIVEDPGTKVYQNHVSSEVQNRAMNLAQI